MELRQVIALMESTLRGSSIRAFYNVGRHNAAKSYLIALFKRLEPGYFYERRAERDAHKNNWHCLIRR